MPSEDVNEAKQDPLYIKNKTDTIKLQSYKVEKGDSRFGSTIASLFLLIHLVLPISSCSHGRPGLSDLRKESLALSQQSGNRALSAEGRLRIAHELFEHRRTYESIKDQRQTDKRRLILAALKCCKSWSPYCLRSVSI